MKVFLALLLVSLAVGGWAKPAIQTSPSPLPTESTEPQRKSQDDPSSTGTPIPVKAQGTTSGPSTPEQQKDQTLPSTTTTVGGEGETRNKKTQSTPATTTEEPMDKSLSTTPCLPDGQRCTNLPDTMEKRQAPGTSTTPLPTGGDKAQSSSTGTPLPTEGIKIQSTPSSTTLEGKTQSSTTTASLSTIGQKAQTLPSTTTTIEGDGEQRQKKHATSTTPLPTEAQSTSSSTTLGEKTQSSTTSLPTVQYKTQPTPSSTTIEKNAQSSTPSTTAFPDDNSEEIEIYEDSGVLSMY